MRFTAQWTYPKYTYLLEVGASSDDLVHEIFNREDIILGEGLLNHSVVGQRNTLLVNLAVATLVDEFSDGLEVRLAAQKLE